MRKVLKWTGGVVFGLVGLAAIAIAIGPPEVPAEAIANAVERTPATMDRAFALPVARRYGRELHWQSNGSLCGPASLVNVLRSLDRDVGGEDEVLEGSGLCWTGACIMGLTLDQLADVARGQPGISVTVLRDLGPDEFLDHMRLSNDPERRYIVNFTRQAIFDAGGGHHSPIGGYLEAEDKVLVLDVNEDFKPWLIERERLFAAIDTVDGSSDQKRGLLLIEPTEP